MARTKVKRLSQSQKRRKSERRKKRNKLKRLAKASQTT